MVLFKKALLLLKVGSVTIIHTTTFLLASVARNSACGTSIMAATIAVFYCMHYNIASLLVST